MQAVVGVAALPVMTAVRSPIRPPVSISGRGALFSRTVRLSVVEFTALTVMPAQGAVLQLKESSAALITARSSATTVSVL